MAGSKCPRLGILFSNENIEFLEFRDNDKYRFLSRIFSMVGLKKIFSCRKQLDVGERHCIWNFADSTNSSSNREFKELYSFILLLPYDSRFFATFCT